MIPSSAALKTWKNAESRASPIAVLFDIEIDSTTTLRLVEGDPTGTGSVAYGGNSYLAAAISRQDQDQNIEGDIGTFTISVSNINGVAAGYIERYELDGNKVTITQVPLSILLAGTPGATDKIVEVYTIQDQTYNRTQASISVGPPNFFKRKMPWRKFQRMRCQWDWENRFVGGNGCGYPSDMFSDDTTQDFLVGGLMTDQARRFGWRTLNAANADTFDVNMTNLEGLLIEVEVANAEWSGTTQAAPFAFKLIDGNFSVNTDLRLVGSSSDCLAGILCVDSADLSTWVHIGCSRIGDTSVIKLVYSQDGAVTSSTPTETTETFLRLSRSASTFTAARSADGITWTSLSPVTVTMDSTAHLGLCVSSTAVESGVVGADFHFFKFTSGGIATCDRTLSACQDLGNAHRIFAFPGIPRA